MIIRMPFVLIVTILLGVGQVLPAQVTDERVRQSLQSGVRFLLSKQKRDGSWPEADHANFPGGLTSLCTLALLNAGRQPDDPAVAKALQWLRKQKLESTYAVSLQTIVFCTAEPETSPIRIGENVAWLQSVQRKAGEAKGSWSYGESNPMQEDPSNAQFALLALYEADRAGFEVKDSTWLLAMDYWKRTQKPDGSFVYGSGQPSSGSMTCAGIGSMIIASGKVNELDARIVGDQVQCCGGGDEADDAIERGLEWLGKNFSVRRNPSSTNVEGLSGRYRYYYLYALERVGRLAGRRFIGNHDWYREGVEELLDQQDRLSGFWQDGNEQLAPTAFATLFLSKGRRPVLMSKIRRQPEHDWNHHRHDVAHLTSYVEKRWKQDLTWQVVDLSAATAEDLWQSPVLFISGRDALEIDEAGKESLKEYVQMGGFVFAENCCGGEGFDRDFRGLMQELFPESELKQLKADHPVWVAEQLVSPRPLLGLEACCRTGVIYCPNDLSCYWELAKQQRNSKETIPKSVIAKVKDALALGANIVTYATGRELKRKLDTEGLVSVVKNDVPLDRAALHIAKLRHNGGSDDAPTALANVLSVVAQQTDLSVSVDKRLVTPLDPNLPDYPIAFLHGRRAFRWSQAERAAIRRFVEFGGVIFADAICADDEFATSFRREMEAIFPEFPLRRIPPSHEMFTDAFQGHDLRTVTLRDPRSRRGREKMSVRLEKVKPLLEGIQIDNRFVVMFSPHDMSCALENQPSLECRGYTRLDAARLATNIILYAMQQ